MNLELAEAGFHWAEIFFEERLLTRSVLNIRYERVITPEPDEQVSLGE